MSSYFDMMATILQKPERVIELAEKQYSAYLSDLADNVVPEDEQKLSDIITKFYGIRQRVEKRGLGKEWIIEEMHDLAHELAQSDIRLRDGRRAGDNPDVVY